MFNPNAKHIQTYWQVIKRMDHAKLVVIRKEELAYRRQKVIEAYETGLCGLVPRPGDRQEKTPVPHRGREGSVAVFRRQRAHRAPHGGL